MMQVSEIDEDLIGIIDFLNEKGMRPYASCDGVHAHHEKNNLPNSAYIVMLKSNKIIDLMAAFRRDRDSFSIDLSNNSHVNPYKLYGNEISGVSYQVNFPNVFGERTQYVEKIVKGIVDR